MFCLRYGRFELELTEITETETSDPQFDVAKTAEFLNGLGGRGEILEVPLDPAVAGLGFRQAGAVCPEKCEMVFDRTLG